MEKMHIYSNTTGKELGIVQEKYSDGTQWLVVFKDRYNQIYTVEANRVIDKGDHYLFISDY